MSSTVNNLWISRPGTRCSGAAHCRRGRPGLQSPDLNLRPVTPPFW